MKRSILIISLAFIATFASAQKLNSKDIPAEVSGAFAKLFPTIKDPKWVKEGINFEANFDFNKVETSVTFDTYGNALETESEIKVSELPKIAIDYMKKTYPEKKIKEASKIIDNKGTITYEAEGKGIEVIFNANGNFLKEIKQEIKD